LNEATRKETNAYYDVYLLRTMGLPEDNVTLLEKIAEHEKHAAARRELQSAFDEALGLARWRKGWLTT
jgi:TPR repeat protein